VGAGIDGDDLVDDCSLEDRVQEGVVLADGSRAQSRLRVTRNVLDLSRDIVDPSLHRRGDDPVHPHPTEVGDEVAV
jgi:hypothetical protein